MHYLEGRINSLEESLFTVKNGLTGLTSRVDQVYDPQNRPEEDIQRGAPTLDLVGTEDSVDAMGTVRLVEEGDSGFFGISLPKPLALIISLIMLMRLGPSSNVAFLRHLTRAIALSGTLNGEIATSAREAFSYEGDFVNASRPPMSSGRRSSKQRKETIFTLPSQTETLRLVHKFFSDTGILFPYIYPPTFLETYHQMVRENFTSVRRTWLGLLNMILAMSTITTCPNDTLADTRTESDVFYQRGVELSGSEILYGTTLEVG